MAIYDSQSQSKSTRNSRKFRDLDLSFGRNIVTNDVNTVEAGLECGIGVEGIKKYLAGDRIVAYKINEIKRKLS